MVYIGLYAVFSFKHLNMNRKIIPRSVITDKIFVLPDDTRIFPGHGDNALMKEEKEKFAVFCSRHHPPDLSGDVLWLSS